MRGRPRRLGLLARLGPFRNAYLLRGLAVWALTRLALAWARVLDPGPPAELALLGVVAVAVCADARRRSEDVFLGNLGIPAWTIGLFAVPLAALAEILVP